MKPLPKQEKKTNIVTTDYTKLTYKVYPDRVKVGIDIGESRFPAGDELPVKRKYDENGNYVKHMLAVKNKEIPSSFSPKAKKKDSSSYSLGELERKYSASNPANNPSIFNGTKRS